MVKRKLPSLRKALKKFRKSSGKLQRGTSRLLREAGITNSFGRRQRQMRRRLPRQPHSRLMNTNPKQVMESFYQERQRKQLLQALKSKRLSANTQAMLQRVMHIQNKGKRDDSEQQRRIRERRLIQDSTDIMKTPFIFKDHQLDITGVDNSNILLASNLFRENPENNILKTTRRSILNTEGNNIMI